MILYLNFPFNRIFNFIKKCTYLQHIHSKNNLPNHNRPCIYHHFLESSKKSFHRSTSSYRRKTFLRRDLRVSSPRKGKRVVEEETSEERSCASTFLTTEKPISDPILKVFRKHDISTASRPSLDTVQLPEKN